MIDLRKSAYIWIACLKRENKVNAPRPEILKDTHSIASNAHEARALFLTGTGTVFNAGANFDAVKNGLATLDPWEKASDALEKLPGLTIAALNGTLAEGRF